MANEQQHANGALNVSLMEASQAYVGAYGPTMMTFGNHHFDGIDAVLQLFANRPASWNAEQIEAAMRKVMSDTFTGTAIQKEAGLEHVMREFLHVLQPMPKLKTPEERVTVELGTTTYDLRSGGMTWEPAATPATGVEQVHAPKTIVPEPDQRRIETERFP